MKRIALLLALVLAFGACFAACGGKKDNKDQGPDYVMHVGDYQSVEGTAFKSSDSEIVEVTRDNLLRACKPGTVTVSGKNGKSSVKYTVQVVDLSGVTLGTDFHSVSLKKVQETIDAEIANLMSNNAQYTEVTDRKDVREGDKVNIDYVGKKDGVAFEGGTGTYDLVIGSGSFIAGFEEGLIGKENGTTVDLDLTFPTPYPNNPDLAGKPVVFTVTINKISAPEPYSDEFVKKATGYDTIEAYEAQLKRLAVTDLMFSALSSKSVIGEIPQVVKDYYYKGYVQDMINYMANYGMQVSTKEEIISLMGYTEENFDKMVWESVTTKIEQDYVFYRYCEVNGLKLTDELYQKHLASFLKQYDCKDEAEMLKEYGITLDTLYETFLYEVVMDHLYAQAEIVDDLLQSDDEKNEEGKQSDLRMEYSTDMLNWKMPSDAGEMFE